MPKEKTRFTKSTNTRIKLPTSSMGAWLTNVGKSVGYSAQEVFTEMMPATMEYATGGAEMVREFRNKMVGYRTKENGLSSAIDKSVYNEIARDAIANAKEAIRTGKFYDPEKEKYDDGFGDLGDFGDFDYGDDDFGFDMDVSDGDGFGSDSSKDSNGKPSVTNVKVNLEIGESSPIVQSIQGQTKVAIEANEQAIGVMKANHTMLMGSFTEFDNKLSGYFGALNENVGTLTSTVSTTLTQHASLSAKYYTDSMTVFNNIYQSLQAIQTMMQPQQLQEGKRYDSVLDIFSSNGTLDLGAYGKLVKKQATSAIESNIILSQLFNAAKDVDQWRYLAANPLKFIPETVMKTLIGTTVRESVKAFDETLSQTMIAGLHRIKGLSTSGNPILEFIGNTFGIDNKLKTNVDKSNYVRGKVDWDGESKKTLVEVIPYYLRKITAALTGEREQVFDYNQGVFRTMKEMSDARDYERKRMFTNGMSDITSGFRDFVRENVKVTSRSEQQKIFDTMDKFATTMVRNSGMKLERRKYGDGYTFLPSIAEMLGTSPEDPMTKLIAGYMDGQNHNTIMGLSSQILDQRNAITRKMQDIEEGKIASNEMYFNNGTTFDKAYDKYGNVDYSKTSLGGSRDKFGRTSIGYLRDILSVLTTGVKVWVVGGSLTRTRGNTKVSTPSTDNAIFSLASNIQTKFGREEEKIRQESAANISRERGDYTRESIDRMDNRGVLDYNADEINVSQIATTVRDTRETRLRAERDAQDAKTLDFLMRITDLQADAPLVKMLNKVLRTAQQKPGELVKGFFGKADDFLFRLVFGGKPTEGGSMVRTAMATLQNYFKKFAGNFNNLIAKMQDALFNEKTGLITQIKNSKFGTEMKVYYDRLKEFMFGTKDADGNYQGGLFSDTATELKNIGANIKESLIGNNENSVWYHVKSAVSEKVDNALDFMGIKKDDSKPKSETPIQDTLNAVHDTAVTRINSFMDDTIGKDTERRKQLDSIQQDLTGKKGKLGAGATLGVLGSFFLPGGPILGAFLGLGRAAVKESETLQTILFGKYDEETGAQEKAGLISKDLVNLYNDNKKGIGAGLALATVAKFGLIPSFLVPGGPIGGALIGLGASVAINSESFQEFMYGPLDDQGNRVGNGFADKMKNAFGEFDKGRFVDAGIGAGIGFIGGMFTPLGPAGGAILGSAIGLASSTENFKRFLFGDYVDASDPSKGRKGNGIIGKAYDKVISPLATEFKVLQTELYGWIQRKILIPTTLAMKPIVTEVKYIKDKIVGSITSMFTNLTDYVKQVVVEPIGRTVDTFILSPIKGLFNGLFGGLKTVAGTIISAPFRALEMMSYGLNRRQMKRGENKWVDDTLGATITGVDSEGNKVGAGGRIAGAAKYILGGRKARDAARFGPNGAPYGDIREQRNEAVKASKAYETYKKKALRAGQPYMSEEEFYRENGYTNILARAKKKGETTAKPEAPKVVEDINSKIRTKDGAVKVYVTNQPKPDNAAFGKKITKLGEYVLSPGEIVIPNSSFDRQMKDYQNEKAYIATKYGDPDAKQGFAFGTMFPSTASYIDGLKEKRAAEKAEKKSQKEKEDAELKATQHTGSFANRMKQWKEENYLDEQRGFMNNVMINLQAIAGATQTYVSDWGKLWNKKSGVITLLLMTGGPLILKLVKNISGFVANILNGVNSFKNIFDVIGGNLSTGFQQVGGSLKGVALHAGKNVKGAITSIKDLFDPTSGASPLERLQNFLTPYDEETGEYTVDAYTNQKTAALSHILAGGVIKASKRYGQEVAEDGTIKGVKALNGGKTIASKVLTSAGRQTARAINTGRNGLYKVVDVDRKILTTMYDAGKSIASLMGDMAKDLPKQYIKSVKSVYGSLYKAFVETPAKFASGVSDIVKIPGKMFQDISYNMADDATKMQMNAARMAAESTPKKPSVIKTELGKMGSALKEAGSTFVDDVKTIASPVTNKVDGMTQKFKYQKSLAKMSIQSNLDKTNEKGLVGKATKYIDDLVNTIANSKAFSGIKGFGEGFKKGFKKIFGAVGGLDDFLQKNSAEIIKKLAAKAPGKMGSMLLRVGSLGLADVVFAGFGLADGAASASNLFQVDEQYVDGKMRTISAVFRALLNTTPGLIIDIINQIMATTVGINFVRELAVLIYGLISTDTEVENLKTGMTDFDNQYEAYVKEEYDKWIKSEEGQAAVANGEYSGNWETDQQKFKESAKADTKADFNNRKHQTLTTKIATSVSSFVRDVGSGKGNANVFSKEYWAIPEGLTDEEAASTRMKQLVMSPVYLVGGVINGTISTVKDLTKGLVSAGKGVISGIGDTFTKIHGIGDVFSKQYWDSGVPDSKGDLEGSFKSIGNTATKFLMFPMSLVYGIGQSAWNGLKTIVTKIAETSAKASTAADFSLMSINGLGDVFNSNYWEAPTDDAGNPMSALNRAAFYGIRAITFIPAVAIGAAKSLGSVMAPVINPIKEKFMNWVGFDLDSDTGAPVDEEGNPLSGVAVAAYYGAKALQIPVKLITWVGENAGKVISPIASCAGKVLGDMFTDIVTAGEVVKDPLSIFSSSYWSMSGADYEDESMSTLRKVGFYAGRVLMAPHMAAFGVVKQVFKTISDIVGNPGDFGDLFNWNKIKTMDMKEYWKKPRNESGETVFSGLSGIIFILTRSLFAIPFYLNKAFDKIGSSIGKAVSWVKDLLGIDPEELTESETSNTRGGGVGRNTRGGNGEMVNGFPYYSQNDPSTKDDKYAYSSNGGRASKYETMGNRGCGPTALAMVNDALNNRGGSGESMPTRLANIATKGGFSTSAGTTPEYFTTVGSKLGMNVTEADASADNIRYMLNSGKPVIIQGQSSAKGSPYTSSGHYVVAVGIDKNGNVLINDPRGKKYSKAYSMDAVTNGSYRAWGFDSSIPSGMGGSIMSLGKPRRFMYYGGNGVSAQAQALVNHALSYVGYREKKSNSNLEDFKSNAGKGNYNRFSKIYNDAMGTHFTNAAWCAIFVSVMFIETFGVEEAKRLLCGHLFSLCANGVSNFKAKKQFFTSDPQPGDIVFFNFEGGKYANHVGIVVADQGSTVITVEGNTTEPGNSSYEGVYQKTRSKKDIIGYGRPAYDGATVIATDKATSKSSSSPSATSLSSALSQFAEAYTNPIREWMFGVDDSSENTGGATDTVSVNLKGNSNAEKIWNFLKEKGFSDAAAAGIMGNIYAESGINPMNIQNSFEKKLGSDEEYTAKVDNGSYKNFANDKAGYGIVQWTYPSRKQALYNYTKSKGTSIGDLGTQLEYMWNEAVGGNYPTAMKNMSVTKASNYWMTKYEKPADQSASAQAKRAGYSKDFYNQFSGGNGEGLQPTGARSMNKRSNVLNKYRSAFNDMGGNGNELSNDEVVQLLSAMLVEMQGTNAGINKFNDKEFKVINNPVTIQDNSSRNVVNTKSTPPKTAASNNTPFLQSEDYAMAKKIAAGDVVWN